MAGFSNGKVSYMQIPATDGVALGAFYEKVFGWELRGDANPDHRSFSDATGEMIGAFVSSLKPTGEPGVLPFISVDDIEDAVAKLAAAGAAIVRPIYPEGDLRVANFRDPQGNVIGVWQMP